MEHPMRHLGSRMVRLEVPTLIGPARGQRTTIRGFGLATVCKTLIGHYEAEQSAFLRDQLASASTFLDVGAARGYFVRLACRSMPEGAAIIAFEPDRVAFDELRALTREQPSGRVTARPEALADGDGTGRLLSREGLCSRLDGVALAPDGGAEAEHVVTVRSVDSLVRAGEIASPDVVKIDTEGAELAVLIGMKQTMAARRPALVVECHSMPLLRDVLSVVIKAEYGAVRVTRGGDGVGPPTVLARC